MATARLIPITAERLEKVDIAFALPSMGMSAQHTLEQKFAALQASRYRYAVLGFAGYMAWVRSRKPDLPASTCPPHYIRDDEPDPQDDAIWEALYAGAEDVKQLATSHGVKIIVLQPISQYEGWYSGSHRSAWVREKAKRWLKLCCRLGVSFLQLGTNDDPAAKAPFEKVLEDFLFIAELGKENNVKISIENWSFSTQRGDWEDCWTYVKAADHPNLGLCLDTAHLALSEKYGWNPTTGSGFTDDDVQGVLSRLRKLPGDKIHFFEISDCCRPTKEKPLFGGSIYDDYHRAREGTGQQVAFTWHMCARCLPYVGANAGADAHHGGFGEVRVAEIAKAVFETGFNGPISFEVFEAQYMDSDDKTVPERYVQAGLIVKKRLYGDMLR